MAIMSDSILTSVKKLLGIEEDMDAFDVDILMNINAALFTLKQIGVGSAIGFTVESKNDTFHDFLGDNKKLIDQVKMYLYYKTKLGFDPPTNPSLLESIKAMIQEAEWRLLVETDPADIFENGNTGDSDMDEIHQRLEKLEAHSIMDSDIRSLS